MPLSNKITTKRIIENNIRLIKINYVFNHRYIDFLFLSEDLNLIINSFLSSYIEVKFKLPTNIVKYHNINYVSLPPVKKVMTSRGYIDFVKLPEDINWIINSFLSSYVEVKFNKIEYYNIKYDLNMITQINLQNLIELFQWTTTEMEYEDIIYVLTTDLMHTQINRNYINNELIII